MKLSNRANQYTGEYWTEERKEELRKLWFSNMPIQEMADRYGVKPDTIYTWCSRRFKFGRRSRGTLIQGDSEKMKFMLRNYPHMSDATLAVYFGVSKDCVRDTAARLGLTKTEQLRKEETAYRIKRVWESRKQNIKKHGGTYSYPEIGPDGRFMAKSKSRTTVCVPADKS